MNKTNVMIEFSAIGDIFDPNAVTDKLSIEPTGYYMKGEKIGNKNLERKETCWYISTGYEETLYVNDQLKKIVDLMKNKTGDLIELKNKYDLEYKIFIVIRVEQNQAPAIYIDSEIIEFANTIKAEFDFDLYIF